MKLFVLEPHEAEVLRRSVDIVRDVLEQTGRNVEKAVLGANVAVIAKSGMDAMGGLMTLIAMDVDEELTEGELQELLTRVNEQGQAWIDDASERNRPERKVSRM